MCGIFPHTRGGIPKRAHHGQAGKKTAGPVSSVTLVSINRASFIFSKELQLFSDKLNVMHTARGLTTSGRPRLC